MDFHQFSNLPVIDGHIHITHLSLAASLIELVQDMHFARINFVATPDQKFGNHNPALIYFKMHLPQTTIKCGAMDYLSTLADPKKAPQVMAAQVKALNQTGFDGIKILIGLIPGVA